LSDAREAPVEQHVIAVGDDEPVLVTEGVGGRLDELEEAFAARRDMRAMLDVGRRPVALGGDVVPFVESVSKASKTNALFCCSVVLMACLLSRSLISIIAPAKSPETVSAHAPKGVCVGCIRRRAEV
jgi:hypothetical protein